MLSDEVLKGLGFEKVPKTPLGSGITLWVNSTVPLTLLNYPETKVPWQQIITATQALVEEAKNLSYVAAVITGVELGGEVGASTPTTPALLAFGKLRMGYRKPIYLIGASPRLAGLVEFLVRFGLQAKLMNTIEEVLEALKGKS